LNVTPPEFQKQEQRNNFDVISQEMGVFDSQESGPENTQERDL
jgi:hypothetical protein